MVQYNIKLHFLYVEFQFQLVHKLFNLFFHHFDEMVFYESLYYLCEDTSREAFAFLHLHLLVFQSCRLELFVDEGGFSVHLLQHPSLFSLPVIFWAGRPAPSKRQPQHASTLSTRGHALSRLQPIGALLLSSLQSDLVLEVALASLRKRHH